jgi:hypothetical protein
MRMSAISNIVMIILNLLVLAVLILIAPGYWDVSNQAANGSDPLRFMAVDILSFLSLGILGTILIVCKNRLQIPTLNALVPIIGIAAFYVPLVINGPTPIGQNTSVHNYLTRVGIMEVGIARALGIMIVIITILNLIPKHKGTEINQPQ